jgi:beta-phosphoglucomutase
MTKGLIFDLDGVITDTAEYHFLSWKRLAEEEGLTFTRHDNEALRGVSRRASLELLLKGSIRPEPEMEAMMTRKNAYYLDYVSHMTPADLLKGVSDFLYTARDMGFKLGLGSASKNARLVCERLQVLSLFDVLGDGFSVVNGKPAPDLFVWVAGGLGLSPADCIVFEDAEAGIDAALAGGFYTVGIGPAERVGKAHRLITGLHDVHPREFA